MRSIRAPYRMVLTVILLLLAWPAGAADGTVVLSAILQMNGKEITLAVNIVNQSQVDVEIVTVEIASRKGILEMQKKSAWTRVERLRLPGHTELRMDSVHGPRVRLPSGSAPPPSGNAIIVLSTGKRITTPYVTLSEARPHGS